MYTIVSFYCYLFFCCLFKGVVQHSFAHKMESCSMQDSTVCPSDSHSGGSLTTWAHRKWIYDYELHSIHRKSAYSGVSVGDSTGKMVNFAVELFFYVYIH